MMILGGAQHFKVELAEELNFFIINSVQIRNLKHKSIQCTHQKYLSIMSHTGTYKLSTMSRAFEYSWLGKAAHM